jgi:hypothetical protein
LVGRIADVVTVGVGAERAGLARVDHAVQVPVLHRIGEPVAVGIDAPGDLPVADGDRVGGEAFRSAARVRRDRDVVVGASVEPGHHCRERSVRAGRRQAGVHDER